MFRGDAGLILAQIFTDFPATHPSLEKSSIRFILSPQCSRTCARAPCLRTIHRHLQTAFSHRMLRKEKRKALDRIQLKKCHPLTHCTSVTSFSQIITGFSAPSFLDFHSHPIFMTPSILLIPQNHGCSLLNQASNRGGQTELQ